MDIKMWGSKSAEFIKKYRYAVLILVLGIVLMLLPGKTESNNETDPLAFTEQTQNQLDIAQELTQILCQIQGVGKVQVMLTVSMGEQTIYQFDEDLTTNDSGSVIRRETVIISGSNREEQALISHVIPPKYMGAIVVCQGADQASVKLAVLDAVSKITGLSSDKISVLKMK